FTLNSVFMNSLKYLYCVFISLYCIDTLNAQIVAPSETNLNLEWSKDLAYAQPQVNGGALAIRMINQNSVPVFHYSFYSEGRAKLEFYDLEYEVFSGFEAYAKLNLQALGNELVSSVYYTLEGNQPITGFYICPFKKEGNVISKLVSFKYKIISSEPFAGSNTISQAKRSAANSVLGTGEWYKIRVNKDGIFRISGSLLATWGIDINSLDPRTLKIYGHHGGMLPEKVASPRPHDLPENAILVMGENDGKMDPSDEIFFYAQGPDKWKRDLNLNRFKHETNIYEDYTYYFLTF